MREDIELVTEPNVDILQIAYLKKVISFLLDTRDQLSVSESIGTLLNFQNLLIK